MSRTDKIESFYLKELYSHFVVRFQPANFGWRTGWRAIFKETGKEKTKRFISLKGQV